jgi:hypothetical protein
MASRDRNTIDTVMSDFWAAAGVARTFQPVAEYMRKWFDSTGNEVTGEKAIQRLRVLIEVARDLAVHPENWVTRDRFDSDLFQRSYLIPPKQGQTQEAYQQLQEALGALDTAYGEKFLVSSAQQFLEEMANWGEMVQQNFGNREVSPLKRRKS